MSIMFLNHNLKIKEEIDVISKQIEENNKEINNLNHRIEEIWREVEQIMHFLALANRRPDLKKRRRA